MCDRWLSSYLIFTSIFFRYIIVVKYTPNCHNSTTLECKLCWLLNMKNGLWFNRILSNLYIWLMTSQCFLKIIRRSPFKIMRRQFFFSTTFFNVLDNVLKCKKLMNFSKTFSGPIPDWSQRHFHSNMKDTHFFRFYISFHLWKFMKNDSILCAFFKLIIRLSMHTIQMR